jgi:hypothetical protein
MFPHPLANIPSVCCSIHSHTSTLAQASWLRHLDCGLAQGSYFAKPSGIRMTALLFENDVSWLFRHGLP